MDQHRFAKATLEFSLHAALEQNWYMENISYQQEVWFFDGKLCGHEDYTHLWYFKCYVEAHEKFSLEEWQQIVTGNRANIKIHVRECKQQSHEARWDIQMREAPTTAQFDSNINNINIWQHQTVGFIVEDDRFLEYSLGNSHLVRWSNWRDAKDQEEAQDDYDPADSSTWD